MNLPSVNTRPLRGYQTSCIQTQHTQKQLLTVNTGLQKQLATSVPFFRGATPRRNLHPLLAHQTSPLAQGEASMALSAPCLKATQQQQTTFDEVTDLNVISWDTAASHLDSRWRLVDWHLLRRRLCGSLDQQDNDTMTYVGVLTHPRSWAYQHSQDQAR